MCVCVCVFLMNLLLLLLSSCCLVVCFLLFVVVIVVVVVVVTVLVVVFFINVVCTNTLVHTHTHLFKTFRYLTHTNTHGMENSPIIEMHNKEVNKVRRDIRFPQNTRNKPTNQQIYKNVSLWDPASFI